MSQTHESREQMGHADFKQTLIDAVFSPTTSIRNGIISLDLGALGIESEAILDRSLESTEKLERGKVVYVTQEKKVIFPVEDTVGIQTDMGQELRLNPRIMINPNAPLHERQDKYIGASMHCHPIDLPPSPTDLLSLFSPGHFPERMPAIFITTQSTKYVVFRGENTPNWDTNQRQEKDNLWISQYVERLRNVLPGNASIEKALEINRRATTTLINQIAQKYDLRIYKCPTSQNTAIKSATF